MEKTNKKAVFFAFLAAVLYAINSPFSKLLLAHVSDTMMASFAAMVRGEKENPYTYEYELNLYKTVLKACGVENV